MSDARPVPAAKRAILAEGLKLFATHGVDAVSVRDIAQATAFSNPALFRHFPSKEALAAALFEERYAALVEALERSVSRGGLEAWLRAALETIAASPEGVVFVLTNLKRCFDALPEALRARNLPRLVREMLEREQARGAVRADLDARLATALILGVLGQIARATHFRDEELDVEATARRLADLLLRGLDGGGAS